jgi:hypothetical protein
LLAGVTVADLARGQAEGGGEPVPTYSQDPLHPDRLRCDRCGKVVAAVAGPDVSEVEHLTVHQIAEFIPEAAAEAEMHGARCGWGEEGNAL